MNRESGIFTPPENCPARGSCIHSKRCQDALAMKFRPQLAPLSQCTHPQAVEARKKAAEEHGIQGLNCPSEVIDE
jgi:hypothetical protein